MTEAKRLMTDALRDFKARKGSHRRLPADTIRELLESNPDLSSMIDPVTETQLRFYWR